MGSKESKIKSFWKNRVDQFGKDSRATLRETQVREAEIKTIQKYLSHNRNIVDIGCGNGYSTIQWAKHFRSNFLGIDFVPEMISVANQHLSEVSSSLKGNLRFEVGDVQKLTIDNNYYDIAITERTLQNIPSFNKQIESMQNISNILKNNGIFLMLECSSTSVEKINRRLVKNGKEPINPEPWHNLFFNDDQLIREAETKTDLKLKKIIRFSSNYIYVTRIMSPIWRERLFRIGFEKVLWKLPQIGDWGYFKLYIWKKKN